MGNLSIPLLIVIFLFSAAVIWFAGVSLTKATDTLDTRFKFGDALGGLILLGIAGTLPEIAVVVSAAIKGHYDIIIGNLIGGISIQVVIIIIFDFLVKGKRPLSYLAGTTILALEGLFSIILVAFAIVGSKLPVHLNLGGISPISIVIVLAWVLGLYLIDKLRQIKTFSATAEDANPGRKHHERRATENHAFFRGKTNLHVILIFLAGSIVTLIAGFLLEESGSTLAGIWGIGAGVFAATIMSLVTALPEISTGVESILIGDNQLSISDVFGGNAFMPVVFILADVISKKPILTLSTSKDINFAILGIVLTAIYSLAYIRRPGFRFLRLGIDSILVFVVYIIGLALIFTR